MNNEITQKTIKERYVWKRVVAPKAWRPKPGEEIVGYHGKTKRKGSYGDYEVVLVMVPSVGVLMISGTKIVQLVDAATMVEGQPMRIFYHGVVALGGDRTMKDFSLAVADGIRAEEEPAGVANDH